MIPVSMGLNVRVNEHSRFKPCHVHPFLPARIVVVHPRRRRYVHPVAGKAISGSSQKLIGHRPPATILNKVDAVVGMRMP